METDIQKQVSAALAKRKGEWRKIAGDLKGVVSYSLISNLGRQKYASEVGRRKLSAIHAYLLNPRDVS